MMASGAVCALDIGTRKVAGIIASLDADGKLVVEAAAVAEHGTRCMMDGQVHDVPLVAATVRRVLDELERTTGAPVRRVAVAAAGRALTCRPGTAMVLRDPRSPVTDGERQAAVLAALAAAREAVGPSDGARMHCVGFTVTGFRLDGEAVGNPSGQRGEALEASVLATFLPERVLDGLLGVLAELSVTAHSVNLEPIAALSVSLPPDARRINLALVDLGAGTSDIAVCRGGSVTAFAMVPVAGDELTEKLCEAFFLDFVAAERVKRAANGEAAAAATSLIGQALSLSPVRIREALAPAVVALADRIGGEIERLNGGAPIGVVLVGGTSQAPGIAETIADRLSLPADRVGVRESALLPWIEDRTGRMRDAAAVTTLGIAWCALRGEVLHTLTVTVDGRRVSLVRAEVGATVSEALLAGGIATKKVWGRPGLALTVTVDGELAIVPGEPGQPLVVRRNGAASSLDLPLADGDALEVEPARDGIDAFGTIARLLGPRCRVPIAVNGREVTVQRPVTMDGELVSDELPLRDRAEIVLGAMPTARDAIAAYGAMPGAAREIGLSAQIREREILVTVNGEPRLLRQRNFVLRRAGAEIALDAQIAGGDALELELGERHLRVSDFVPPPPQGRDLHVRLNGQPVTLPGSPGRVRMNGREVTPDEFVVDGAALELLPGEDARAFVSDVVPPKIRQRSRVRFLVDGEEAQLSSRLSDGATIEIVGG